MRPLALAIALAAPTVALAQPIPVRLADGATWTMTSTHEREAHGSSDPDFSVTVVKTLTWHAAKGGGRLLHQEHVSATANSGIPAEFAFTQTLTIPIDFEVDDDLSPLGIKNAAEAREAALALITRAGGDAKGGGWPPETKARILDAMVQTLVARDLQMLSGSQNTDLVIGKPVAGEAEIGSPFGGPPLKTLTRVSLESYDAKAGKAVVVVISDLDPKSFKAMTDEAARQLAPNAKRTPQADADQPKINISSRCRSELDLATGLSRETRCESTRNMTLADQQRTMIDRWTITQTLPGRP